LIFLYSTQRAAAAQSIGNF